MNKILKSYFYWTYSRGTFHYDVMVTLILLFIFVTPHLWDYGDKPSRASGPAHPIQIVGDGSHGVIVSLQASDVHHSSGRFRPRSQEGPAPGHRARHQRFRLRRALGDSPGRPGKSGLENLGTPLRLCAPSRAPSHPTQQGHPCI